jgi:hypothetical protein
LRDDLRDEAPAPQDQPAPPQDDEQGAPPRKSDALKEDEPSENELP